MMKQDAIIREILQGVYGTTTLQLRLEPSLGVVILHLPLRISAQPDGTYQAMIVVNQPAQLTVYHPHLLHQYLHSLQLLVAGTTVPRIAVPASHPGGLLRIMVPGAAVNWLMMN